MVNGAVADPEVSTDTSTETTVDTPLKEEADAGVQARTEGAEGDTPALSAGEDDELHFETVKPAEESKNQPPAKTEAEIRAELAKEDADRKRVETVRNKRSENGKALEALIPTGWEVRNTEGELVDATALNHRAKTLYDDSHLTAEQAYAFTHTEGIWAGVDAALQGDARKAFGDWFATASVDGPVPYGDFYRELGEHLALDSKAAKALSLEQAAEKLPKVKSGLVAFKKHWFDEGRKNPLPKGNADDGDGRASASGGPKDLDEARAWHVRGQNNPGAPNTFSNAQMSAWRQSHGV